MDHKLAARESDGKRPGKTRTTCTATTASLYSLVIARDAHGLLLYASCWRPELIGHRCRWRRPSDLRCCISSGDGGESRRSHRDEDAQSIRVE
jgi:hypothetical protein